MKQIIFCMIFILCDINLYAQDPQYFYSAYKNPIPNYYFTTTIYPLYGTGDTNKAQNIYYPHDLSIPPAGLITSI